MKIKSLHISGFGNVKDQECNFSQITQIISENGSGKTTLANFIEIMLYGMNAKNTADRDFLPWNNSFFGGALEFESNGQDYKVERTFGQKKANDTFKLYKNGKLSFDFSDELGLELFNLDRESFHRICFFDQTDYQKGKVFISERLNSVICATDEFNNFNSVCKKLEDDIKEYQNRQNRGKIPNVKQKLADAEIELRNLADKKDEYFTLKSSLQEQKEKREKQKVLLSAYEKERDELLKQLSSSKVETKIESLNQARQKTVQKIQKTNEVLNGNAISEEQVNVYIKFCEEVDKKRSELNSLTKSFIPVSEKPLPSEEEIENVEKSYQKIGKPAFSLSLPLCLILAVVSLGLLIFSVIKNVNIPLLIIAVLTLAGAIVLGVVTYKNKTLIKKQRQSVTDFLGKYGYMNYSTSSAFQAIKSDKISQTQAREQNRLLQEEISNIKNEISSLNERIDRFIYSFTNSATDKLSFLYELKNVIKIKEENLSELKDIDKEILKIQSENGNEDLKTEYQKKLNEIKLLKTEIEYDDENVSRLSSLMAVALLDSEKYDNLCVKKQALNGELLQLNKEKEIAEKTLEYLKEAKENLTKGCYEPLKKSLKKYCESLFPTLSGVTCDEDFNVKFLVNGLTKDSHSLSLGQQQLVNFSLRLGLIDSLFDKEKPFIIIDDAFCPLDEENFNLCKKLLKEISKSLQIIYLTPHHSRSLTD